MIGYVREVRLASKGFESTTTTTTKIAPQQQQQQKSPTKMHSPYYTWHPTREL
jgi:hypothetical protein